MTVTDRFSGSALRFLAVLGAMAVAFALLPQTAGAQEPPADPLNACPENAPAAGFTDRGNIPQVHRANVDCAAHFGIVRGFADNTYRPRLQVRRDQMASFIALTLDAAGVDLPAGNPNTFTDVPATNVHADNINRLAAAGIVEGGPVGRSTNQYGPELRTRRDQMASFLMRAAGFALQNNVNAFDSTTQQFTDVPAGNVHFRKVNAAAENRIALGTGGGLYQPRLETRRDQMASFVVRLLNFILTDGPRPPGAPTMAVTIGQCVVGQPTTVTATITQAGQGVQNRTVNFTVTGPATPQTATALTSPAGQAQFQLTATAPETVTVTATSPAPPDGQQLQATASVRCTPPAVTGPITLDQATAPQGGVITGRVDNPGAIQSIVVTGCGFQNEQVNLDAEGRFTLNIPAGQAAGACPLVFTIRYTDGTVQTQTVNFTVTEAARQRTNGPDLISATANPTANTVIYQFDANITGAAPDPALFQVYNAAGQVFRPTAVQIRPDNQSVIAQFGTGIVGTAVRATVRAGAVQDPQGRFAYPQDAPLRAPEQLAGRTAAPDLETVGNIRVVGGLVVADFRFDQPVLNVAGGFGDIDEQRFYLIDSDGVEWQGGAVTAISADARTVTVAFAPPVFLPTDAVRRGAVDPGAVTSNQTAVAERRTNVLQAHDVTAGGTRTPDLVNATVTGPNQVSYRFDTAVEQFTVVANRFRVYTSAGNANLVAVAGQPSTPTANPIGAPGTPGLAPEGDGEVSATTCTRSIADTAVVDCTFAVGTVAQAVGASVEPGAVTQVGAGAPGAINVRDEVALQNIVAVAGRTAIPDLVGVTATIDELGNNRVEYQFDQDATAVPTASLFLVNQEGVIFVPVAEGALAPGAPAGAVCTRTMQDANRTIRLQNCFTNAQVQTSVLGSTQPGIVAAGTAPTHTEGAATAVRS
ncbi:MAG TPA: Ig-like domain-containing protein [Egibacteraceae bacterium]|nr:Ig-like domain-containing protein [Egibacteraceae bacterium]